MFPWGNNETIELTNDGPGAQSIAGWRIPANEANRDYVFLSTAPILSAGDSVQVHPDLHRLWTCEPLGIKVDG